MTARSLGGGGGRGILRERERDGGREREEAERKAAMGRVRGLEECVAAAEASGEQVYRALVNARVSLLNLLTPTF